MDNIFPQRLYLLQLSTERVTVGLTTLEMLLGCYLVQMSDGRRLLIDTGLPQGFARPGAPPDTRYEGKNVVECLRDLGLQPDDIDILICTHFDPDHAGYHDHFTRAELVVQREHYELARGGHPRFASTRAHWDHPDLHYRLVEGDVELLPGVSLLKTSGHIRGHQSVLVRLPQTGPVLLAIDAVMMQRLFNVERKKWPMDEDEEQLRASTQKLLDLVEREQVQLVVFGHDGSQWQTLKVAPAYYE